MKPGSWSCVRPSVYLAVTPGGEKISNKSLEDAFRIDAEETGISSLGGETTSWFPGAPHGAVGLPCTAPARELSVQLGCFSAPSAHIPYFYMPHFPFPAEERLQVSCDFQTMLGALKET